MNTLYVRCQTKDYILDIVAARAGMRINKNNSVVITIVSLYYKKSSLFDTIEISIKCLPFFCVKNW